MVTGSKARENFDRKLQDDRSNNYLTILDFDVQSSALFEELIECWLFGTIE